MPRAKTIGSLLVILCALIGITLNVAPASATSSGQTPPYAATFDDRSFKLDLADALPQPPQLVIFGGSRATRFEPSFTTSLTGLPAMNFALSNFRPEDAWAILNHYYARSDGRPLHVFWGVTANALRDTTLDPGLVHDWRLSAAFPHGLLAQQAALLPEVTSNDLLARNRFTTRGVTLWNVYDGQRAGGLTLDESLDRWIRHYVAGRSWAPHPCMRAKAYLERTLALLNRHGVTPCLVLMPYHPRALAAMQLTRWRHDQAAAVVYLRGLQLKYSLRLLDYTSIGAFDGSARAFYDGAHITRENARILMQHAVRAAPECFR